MQILKSDWLALLLTELNEHSMIVNQTLIIPVGYLVIGNGGLILSALEIKFT